MMDYEELESAYQMTLAELESTKALLEETREKLGRAIGLADEIRKLQDLGGGDE